MLKYQYMRPETKVWVITQCKSKCSTFRESLSKRLYTIPVELSYDTTNTIVSFKYKHIASFYMPPCSNLEYMTLTDLQYMGYLMKMPLIVVDKEYCDIYSRKLVQEVYFASPRNFRFVF